MIPRKRSAYFAALVPFALSLACGSSNNNTGGDAGTGGGMDATGGMDADPPVEDAGEIPPRCTMPTAVQCVDEQIQELLLFNNVSTAAIATESITDGVYTTLVDARGGGLMPTESFVYARFTPAGLEKVEISDEAAFDSMDWHIAFRRYLVRINSGVGGPSCTQAARIPQVTDFAAVTSVPANLTYRSEEYFTTDTCDLVPDGSGLPGAAAVALGAYWTYSMCLQMTGNVFIIALADGRDVKLQVDHYYAEPGAQDTCNQTGSVPMPSGAAQFKFKWAYLP